MKLVIQADSAEDLKQKIFATAHLMGYAQALGAPAAVGSQPLMNHQETAALDAGAPEMDATGKTRVRRTKAQIEADRVAEANNKSAGGAPGVGPAQEAGVQAGTGSTVSKEPAKGSETTASGNGAAGQAGGASAPTQDEVRAALQAVDAKKGMPGVVAVLQKFGKQRISQVEAKDYAAFIAECKAV